MKIDKAIEILSQWDKGTDPLYLPSLPDAVKLGIEALKRLRSLRTGYFQHADTLLPRETKK